MEVLDFRPHDHQLSGLGVGQRGEDHDEARGEGRGQHSDTDSE